MLWSLVCAVALAFVTGLALFERRTGPGAGALPDEGAGGDRVRPSV